MPDYSDDDFSRGYSVSKNGIITLLHPLSPDTLSDLFDHHPSQMAALQVQQVKLEIETPIRPSPRSRQSQAPNGYIFLVAWGNACLLRILMTKWFKWYRGIYKINPKLLDRLEAQTLDALRSTIANIEEGFARPTTIEYLTFLGYAQASLIESKGDGQRMAQDGLLAPKPGSKLGDLGIDLRNWHTTLKKSVISAKFLQSPLSSSKSPLASLKGTYRNLKESPVKSFSFGYPPVDDFDPSKLTCEMVIELINKTDWHLRQLVVSLEEKLNQDKQYYLIEQARLRGKINWRK